MKNNIIIDKDTKKLIENCIKLHYYANPHTILQENKFKYLILESSELKDTIKSTQEILNKTRKSAQDLEDIIINIFSEASANLKNEETKGIAFNDTEFIKYFDDFNKTIDNNIKKINKLSASSNLDSKKNIRKIQNITSKTLRAKLSIKGLNDSVLNFLNSNNTIDNLTDNKSIISTLDEKSAKKLQNEIAKELEKSFNKQQSLGDKFKRFFTKFDKSKLFSIQTDSMFKELAGALLFLPKNNVENVSNKLSAESIEGNKELDELENEAETLQIQVKKPEGEKLKKASNSIEKIVDDWYTNLKEPKKIVPRAPGPAISKLKSDLNKSIENARKQTEIEINKGIESWFDSKMYKLNKDEMENVKKELNPQILDLVLKLKQESKFSINKKSINKIVNSYLNNKFKSKKIINEALIVKNKNNNEEENLIDFKRINQLAGLK